MYLFSFILCDKVVAYVNNKGANLRTFTTMLTIIMSCILLMLIVPNFATCYEYAMLKCCQYTTNDLKVCHVGMKKVLIKEAQPSF
jgi:hypothetical protein